MLHKDKKTGIYYFRKRVPTDLLEVIGKKEFKQSLRTKDRKEAEKLVKQVEREVDQLIESLRSNNLVPTAVAIL